MGSSIKHNKPKSLYQPKNSYIILPHCILPLVSSLATTLTSLPFLQNLPSSEFSFLFPLPVTAYSKYMDASCFLCLQSSSQMPSYHLIPDRFVWNKPDWTPQQSGYSVTEWIYVFICPCQTPLMSADLASYSVFNSFYFKKSVFLWTVDYHPILILILFSSWHLSIMCHVVDWFVF